MPFSAPVLTYRAKGLASNIQSKVLKAHNTLINIYITAILAPEMTYTPQNKRIRKCSAPWAQNKQPAKKALRPRRRASHLQMNMLSASGTELFRTQPASGRTTPPTSIPQHQGKQSNSKSNHKAKHLDNCKSRKNPHPHQYLEITMCLQGRSKVERESSNVKVPHLACKV